MKIQVITLAVLLSFVHIKANASVVTVGQFLRECAVEEEPCIAFVMGVVEGARHQTRETLNAQPYSYKVHGKLVCLPTEWGSKRLTEIVLKGLSSQPQTHRYSAVSGVLYALAEESGCTHI